MGAASRQPWVLARFWILRFEEPVQTTAIFRTHLHKLQSHPSPSFYVSYNSVGADTFRSHIDDHLDHRTLDKRVVRIQEYAAQPHRFCT